MSTRPAAFRALLAACGHVSADGSDPAVLARVLAWCIRPRRGPDALRRACRDRGARVPAPGLVVEGIDPVLTADDARAALPVAERWRMLGVRCAVVGDPAYPDRLADGWPLTDGPTLLAWRGAVPDDGAAVALVGARHATHYGTSVTSWLAQAAAAAGVRVVSGGAVGIDAAAHRAALGEAGGTTVVLGCGHGVPYPRAHARSGGLFDDVLDSGGSVVSELLPDEPPRAGPVRARNRIVAALVDVVVVVEGRARSGALLTAGAAAERGRAVLAVPGDVRAPGSAAPHRLLLEGVGPCTGPQDLLGAVRLDDGSTRQGAGAVEPPGAGGAGAAPSCLPDPVRRVLGAEWPRPIRVEDLAARAAVGVPALLASLTRAELTGEIAQDLAGVRLRAAPRR